MNQDIHYTGYSANPSDYECQDGELAMSLNLINEDGGSLKALGEVGESDVKLPTLGEGDRVIFIHKTTAFTNYIIFNDKTNQLLFNGESLGRFYDLTHCNAIGNTLLAFSKTEIHYFLWQDGKYTDLGNQLPNIMLSFGLIGRPRLFSRTNENSTFTIDFAEDINSRDIRKDFSEANQTAVTNVIMANLNKFIREQTIEKGRFCFPFFVRYALRLYDGTLTGHSAPILMNPSTTPAPIVLWERATGESKYTQAKNCDIMMVAASLDYKVVNNSNSWLDIEKWKDIIKSVDVFISKPLYTYDQDGKILNLKDTDNFQSTFVGKLFHNNFKRNVASESLRDDAYLFPTSVTDDCMIGPISYDKDINGDSFLTRYMEWTYSRIYQLYFSPERKVPGETFHLPEFTDKKNTEAIKSCSNFYKLHSIPLSEAMQTQRKEIVVEEGYLQSLVTREVMTDDYLSHDQIVASNSQVYNNRLNLSGVKRYPFAGFNALTLFSFCDGCVGSYEVNDSLVKINTNNVGDPCQIFVYLRENGKVWMVNTTAEMAPWMSKRYYLTEEDMEANRNVKFSTPSWGSYLFYPNVNAFKMVIRNQYHGGSTQDAYGFYPGAMVIDLQPHEFLNGAYALIDYQTTRRDNYNADSLPKSIVSHREAIDCSSKVYTSQVNNPFFFPVTGINTVGTGKILNIATAAKALSQGQFGQFPLYAFTDEGVWAMEVSGTGTYSAKQPITRDVCINPEGITQIDSAVLFLTNRGIMLISGSQTECISDVLNTATPFDITTFPHMDELHAMLGDGHELDNCIPTVPFLTFIKDCRMIYDYVHQRIIVYNSEGGPDGKGYTYAYVYSLKSKLWGMMYSDIKSNLNSYPNALAVTKDGKLVDFSLDTDKTQPGLLLTRPLKLGGADVMKTIDTVIQRGNFQRGHVQTVLYGSRNLKDWNLVWSSKDHYLRGFRGTPYKYFRIALLCNLDPGESIFGASVNFNPRLGNQLR